MFDAQAYLAALEPPVFIAPNGRRYVGKVLSVDEWEPFQEAMRDITTAQAKAPPYAAGDGWKPLQQVLYRLTDAFFPRPWWRFWQRRVSYWIRRLPPEGQVKAVWDFMRSQGKASGMANLPATPGMTPAVTADGAPAASPTAG